MEVKIDVTWLPEVVMKQLVEKAKKVEKVFEDKCTKDNITLTDEASLEVDFNKLKGKNVYELKQPEIEKLFKISNTNCKFIKFHVSINEDSFGPIPVEYDIFINS
jgi:SpoVK/Ycf46/Vps4 family AAA+-type ATPase